MESEMRLPLHGSIHRSRRTAKIIAMSVKGLGCPPERPWSIGNGLGGDH